MRLLESKKYNVLWGIKIETLCLGEIKIMGAYFCGGYKKDIWGKHIFTRGNFLFKDTT